MSGDEHKSHNIVEVAPRHTGQHQAPVRADHERNVFLSPSGLEAVVKNGRNSGRSEGVLTVRMLPEGGNCLLDPPALVFETTGKMAMVTVESLLYAIRQMLLKAYPEATSGQQPT